MSGKHSRTKGHNFEREVARQFQELGWEDAMTKRAARGGDWSTTDDGIDIVNVEPFAVQCKRLATYVSINTIQEIVLDRYCPRDDQGFAACIDEDNCIGCNHPLDKHTEQIPLLLTKANNKPTMAVLPWEELQKILKGYYKN